MAKFVLTAQIALQAPRNVGQVVNQIKRQLQGVNVNINVNANTRTLNNVNNQLNTTAKAAKTAQNSISELGKSLGLAARRFGAIAIATGTFLSLSRAIKSSLGDAIEFERQLVNLSQVTGKSVQNLQDITKEITRLSTGLGVSSDQLLKTSIILAQAGLEASKTKAALEVLAKTELASSFDNITNTTEGAIAILSQFRREAAAAGGDVIYLERALGAINDVSKKFAVESSDLVAVIRRSGGAFEAAGGSLNELLALFTSVRATTRESAETIATGLRTIFTRIQRVDTIRQLQELGIALQDAEGKFVGPFEAIKRISEGLSGLDPRDFRFAAIVEELGGFRQIGKVIPLIKQFALAQDALNTAQGASSSLTKDAEIAQLSLANQLAKVREEFQALIRRFVDSGSFQTVARGALEFARALIRIADAISPLIPLIAGLAAIQIGKGFIPALGALTGVARRNQGGKIHAFASGGFVPGTGNRDTVPAMLTPGEFVIRKNSAKKIGAERLQRLNGGGIASLGGLGSKTQIYKEDKILGLAEDQYTYQPRKIGKSEDGVWVVPIALEEYKTLKGGGKGWEEYLEKELSGTIGQRQTESGFPIDFISSTGELFDAKDRRTYADPQKEQAKKSLNYSLYKQFGGKGYKFTGAKENKLNFNKNANISLLNTPITEGVDSFNLPPVTLIHPIIEDGMNNISFDLAQTKRKEFRSTEKKGSKSQRKQRKAFGGIIQKFAGGGIVDVLTGQESVAALMMTDASPGQTRIPIKYPDDLKSALESRKQGSESITRGNKLLNSIKLDQYGLNKSAGSDFAARLRENLTNGAASAVNQTVGQMAPTFSGLGIQADFKNLIPGEKVKSAISGGVIGTLFESIIDNLSNQSKDVKDSSFFDFVGPLSDNATKLFEKSESVNNSTYKDAKIQIKAKNIESKIINQASQELGLGTNVQSTGQIQTAQDYIDKLTRAGLYEQFKTTGISFAKLSQAGIKGANKEAALAMLQDKFGVDRIGYRDYQLNQKDPKTGQPRIGRDFFLKYAKGGIASSDTVPALLTPGEFVVNKKTAQEVGYGALNRMNKTGDVQGFAKGGPVGVQRFAQGGGPVTPITPTKAGVSSSGNPNQKAQIQDFINLVKSLTVAANGTKSSFEIVGEATKQLINQYGTLESGTKQVIKANAKNAKAVEKAEKQQLAVYNSQQKQIQKAQEFGASLSKVFASMQNFVFLASTVAAVTAQFTSLNEATKNAIAETAAFASTTIATIGTVGELGNSLLPIGAKAKIMAVVFGGLSSVASLFGVSLTVAIAPLAVIAAVAAGVGLALYYLESRAAKAAEALDKQAEDVLQLAEQGKGGSLDAFVSKRLEAVTAAQQAPSYFFTGEEEKAREIQASKEAATALYSISVSGKALETKLLSLEKNAGLTGLEKASLSIEEINKTFSSAANIFSSSSVKLRELTGGQNIEDLSGRLKVTAQDFDKSIKQAAERMSDALGKSSQFLQQAVEESIKSYDFGVGGSSIDNILNRGLGQTLAIVNKNIAEQAKRQAEQIIANASLEQLPSAEKEATEIIRKAAEAQIDNERAIKSQIQAAEKQAMSASLITQALIQQRNEIIQATGAIKFFSQTVQNISAFNKSLDSTLSRLSGGVSSPISQDIQGISNLNEIIDTKTFKSQLNEAVKPFGDFGAVISDNLGATADILEKAKKTLLNVRFGEGDVQGAINELFEGSNISESLKGAISGLIKDAAQASTEGQSTITASEFENIFAPLLAQSEPFRKAVEGLINSQNELISSNVRYLSEISKLRQEEIDDRRKLVDIETRLQDRLSAVQSKNLSFQEKEARRNLRRGFNAGNRGDLISRFTQASDKIRDFERSIKASKDVVKTAELQKAQASLTLEFNNLKDIMQELADQSDKAADVMSEIDKERAKRDTLTKIVEDFVVGNNEERMSTVRQFQGIEFAAATGSLQGLQPEDRKATFGLLSQLADVDDRFAQLKKNLIFNDAIRMGLDQNLALALANQTPKEQQLIDELKNISNEERAFQAALNADRIKESQGLFNEFGLLSTEINDFPNKLKNSLSEAMAEARAEEQKIADAKIASEERLNQEAKQSADQRAQEQKSRDAAIDKRFQELSTSLNPANTGIAALNTNLINNVASIKQLIEALTAKQQTNRVDNFNIDIQNIPTGLEGVGGMRKGGIVYKAAGGSIFKPKGTDTVPAMLTPGEFVVRKAAVDKYGAGFMQSINSGSYANKGGSVNKFGVSYFENGGLAELVKERAKFLSDSLGVNEKDILGELSFDSNMPYRGLAKRGMESASDLKLNPKKLLLDTPEQRQFAIKVIDHELAHSIDNFFARKSGDRGTLSSIIGNEGTIFRGMSERYFKNPENFKHWLKSFKLDPYITNKNDLESLNALQKSDQIDKLSEENLNIIFKRNPKLLAEGFPLAFQDLPDSTKANLLSSIKEEYAKTGKIPTYEDVKNKYREKTKSVEAEPKKAATKPTNALSKAYEERTRSDQLEQQNKVYSELTSDSIFIQPNMLPGITKGFYANLSGVEKVGNPPDVKEFVKFKPLAGQEAVIDTTEIRVRANEIGGALQTKLAAAGLISVNQLGFAFEDKQKLIDEISNLESATGTNRRDLAEYNVPELIKLRDELKSKTSLQANQEALNRNREAIEAAIQNISALEQHKAEIINTGRYNDLRIDKDGNLTDLNLQDPRALSRIQSDMRRAYASLKAKAQYDIQAMSQITPKNVFDEFVSPFFDPKQAIATPKQVAQQKMAADLEAKKTQETNQAAAAAAPAAPPPVAAPAAASQLSKRQQREQAAQQRVMQALYGPQIDQQEQMNNAMEMNQNQADRQKAWNQIYQKYNNNTLWLEKAGNDRKQASILRDAWYNSLKQFKDEPATYNDPKFLEALYRAKGGSIFQPKGTDTVPAMLTPGEFVIQRSAVQKYGIGTMQAINNGSASAATMNRGGVVYRQNGGPIGGGGSNSAPVFNMEPLMQLKQTFDNLAGVLNNMQMTHTVNVDGALNINGVDAPQVAEAIKQYLGNFIVTEVNKIINNQGKGFQGQQSK